MNAQSFKCVLLDPADQYTKQLQSLLMHVEYMVHLAVPKDMAQLKKILRDAPALAFVSNRVSQIHLQQLVSHIQTHSPDTILVKLSLHQWRELRQRKSGIESCTIRIDSDAQLQQQFDFLLSHSALKRRFRKARQRQKLAESRSHWLVEQSHQSIAYIANGRHIFANRKYLETLRFTSKAIALDTALMTLVDVKEQSAFQPILAQTEKALRPNKSVMLTMKRANGESFRAELLLVPAMYQGQRCIQIHLQDLSERESLPAEQMGGSVNPWATPAASNVALKQKANQASLALTIQALSKLGIRDHAEKGYWVGLRDLKGNREATRWYQQAEKANKRYALDIQALNKAVAFSRRRLERHFVGVPLGTWILSDSERFQTFLQKLLKLGPALSNVVLFIPGSIVTRQFVIAQWVLPTLFDTEARIGIDGFGVGVGSAKTLNHFRRFGVEFVAMGQRELSSPQNSTVNPTAGQSLLQQLSAMEITTLIYGDAASSAGKQSRLIADYYRNTGAENAMV